MFNMRKPLYFAAGKLGIALMLLVAERRISAGMYEEWLFFQSIFFTFIPLLLMRGEGLKLIKNSPKTSVKYALLMLVAAFPIMLYASSLSAFNQYYPIDYRARLSAGNFLRHELVILGIMFNTEFFFRGFLLFTLIEFFKGTGITKEKSEKIGIAVHAVPYMLVHVGKPFLEVPYSFFAGLVFGFADVKAVSVLPSFIAHFVSSVVFDVLSIVQSVSYSNVLMLSSPTNLAIRYPPALTVPFLVFPAIIRAFR